MLLRANRSSLIPKELSSQRVISARQLNNLPINRRNFLDFALLTPGVSDADNVNDSTDFRVAQTPQSGFSSAGTTVAAIRSMLTVRLPTQPSGGARNVVSQEAVQEFQVDRNSYNAEFGGASGGVVNIVSKTGGNDFTAARSVISATKPSTRETHSTITRTVNRHLAVNSSAVRSAVRSRKQNILFHFGGRLAPETDVFCNSQRFVHQRLTISPANAASDQNFFLNYLASRNRLLLLYLLVFAMF